MRGVARALAFSLVLVAVGCGSSKHGASSTTRPPPATDSISVSIEPSPPPITHDPSRREILVYFLRDGKVAPMTRSIPRTAAPARAALAQLVQGLNGDEGGLGLTNDVSAKLAVTRLEIRNGVAILDVDPMISPDSAGFAQIVYTLTQFPTVKRVSIVLETQDAAEFPRADVERFAPPILVESPTPDMRVTSPLRIRGTANTFEAEFRYEIRDGFGNVVASGNVTATSGSGRRGSFDRAIRFPTDLPTLELDVFELSAADGSRIHEVRIPLTL